MEKMDIESKNNNSGSPSSRILGVTTLALALLLTISMSAVIYLSVWQQNSVSQLQDTGPEFVRHGTLKSNTEEIIEERPEEISFYKEENVVFYKEDDGSFQAQDFNKGIAYKKDSDSGQCYLLPVPTKPEGGREIENFLTDNDNVTLEGEEGLFDVLEGEIADISFIPSVVRGECHNGFRWLAKSSNTDADAVTRQKRGWKITIRILFVKITIESQK